MQRKQRKLSLFVCSNTALQLPDFFLDDPSMCAESMARTAPQRVPQHVGVLEWLEAEAEMRPVDQSYAVLPHGTEPPERPPAAELLFLRDVGDNIRHPADAAWTPTQLANGVSLLFEALPASRQQQYCSTAKEGMDKYKAEIARLTSNSGGTADQNEIIKPRRKHGQTERGDTKGVVVTMEILETVFHMPLHKACKALGVCATAMKRVCRKLGVKKWPYRDSAKWW